MIKGEHINISFDNTPLFKKDIDLTIDKNEIVLLYGPSGCGKTTIFQILAGLIKPTKGVVDWNGIEVDNLNIANKTRYNHISMIYSVFNFIETLSTKDNILLPSLFAQENNTKERLENLIEIFDFGTDSNINLKDLLKKNISSLSNGQKEIVSISRSLLMEKPEFIFADEMLRSFNPELEKEVWQKILRLLSQEKKSLFMITHKEHIGESLESCIQQNTINDNYKARILTINKNQELIEKGV